jgi:hypothetical protein
MAPVAAEESTATNRKNQIARSALRSLAARDFASDDKADSVTASSKALLGFVSQNRPATGGFPRCDMFYLLSARRTLPADKHTTAVSRRMRTSGQKAPKIPRTGVGLSEALPLRLCPIDTGACSPRLNDYRCAANKYVVAGAGGKISVGERVGCRGLAGFAVRLSDC